MERVSSSRLSGRNSTTTRPRGPARVLTRLLRWLGTPDGRRQFGKRTLLWLTLTAVLVIEIRLILYDVSSHWVAHSFTKHFIVVIALLVLPLTFGGVVARLPFMRRFVHTRYLIRPFRTISPTRRTTVWLPRGC